MTETINFTHTSAAAEWATSPDRFPLFTVERPNPAYDLERGGEQFHPAPDGSEAEHGPVIPRTLVTTFTMPAKPNAGLALQYLREARSNADTALSWLIETAIGSDGYDALVEELVGKTGDEMANTLAELAQTIQKVAMGGLEAPKA